MFVGLSLHQTINICPINPTVIVVMFTKLAPVNVGPTLYQVLFTRACRSHYSCGPKYHFQVSRSPQLWSVTTLQKTNNQTKYALKTTGISGFHHHVPIISPSFSYHVPIILLSFSIMFHHCPIISPEFSQASHGFPPSATLLRLLALGGRFLGRQSEGVAGRLLLRPSTRISMGIDWYWLLNFTDMVLQVSRHGTTFVKLSRSDPIP